MSDAMFDTIVMVDWSANGAPKRGKDSIWSCVVDAEDDGAATVVNHRTRATALAAVLEVLRRSRGRVLVGFDFSYAYPRGTAAALGLRGESWSALWRHLSNVIVDDERNRSNRFEVAAAMNARIGPGVGPFWGVPPGRASASLSPRKAPGFPHVTASGALDEFRLCERRFLAAGLRVSSPWQLLGAGSVGSQTLTGVPVVHRLRHDPALAHRSVVWPYETGFVPDPTGGRDDAIVHAEVWPGSVRFDPTLHDIRDAAQMIGLCNHLAAARGAELGRLFAPDLSATERDVALREEGWILGAP